MCIKNKKEKEKNLRYFVFILRYASECNINHLNACFFFVFKENVISLTPYNYSFVTKQVRQMFQLQKQVHKVKCKLF